MTGEQLWQERGHIVAVPLDLDEPGLVVDSGADDIDFAAVQFAVFGDEGIGLSPSGDAVGDLPVGALDAVAEAEGGDVAVLVAGPGIHGHGVGVIEEEGVGLGEAADVLADSQQFRDCALGIHDAACTEGIADALVDAVFEGDIDIGLECFESSLPDGADHVIGVCDGFLAVEGCGDFGGEFVGGDVASAEGGDGFEVWPGDVGEGEGGVGEFWNGENVMDEFTGEADRSGADHCDSDGQGATSEYWIDRIVGGGVVEKGVRRARGGAG